MMTLPALPVPPAARTSRYISLCPSLLSWMLVTGILPTVMTPLPPFPPDSVPIDVHLECHRTLTTPPNVRLLPVPVTLPGLHDLTLTMLLIEIGIVNATAGICKNIPVPPSPDVQHSGSLSSLSQSQS